MGKLSLWLMGAMLLVGCGLNNEPITEVENNKADVKIEELDDQIKMQIETWEEEDDELGLVEVTVIKHVKGDEVVRKSVSKDPVNVEHEEDSEEFDEEEYLDELAEEEGLIRLREVTEEERKDLKLEGNKNKTDGDDE